MTGLESDLRRRLYVTVQDYPGLHLRELARFLGVPVRGVEYNADALVGMGLVDDRRDGGYRRLYPNRKELDIPEADRRALGLLRKPVPLGVTLHLLNAPHGLTHAELCQRTGGSKANVSHHLQALVACGLVVHQGLYRIHHPARVQRLLRTHKPVPDLRRRFADTWASLYRMD